MAKTATSLASLSQAWAITSRITRLFSTANLLSVPAVGRDVRGQIRHQDKHQIGSTGKLRQKSGLHPNLDETLGPI